MTTALASELSDSLVVVALAVVAPVPEVVPELVAPVVVVEAGVPVVPDPAGVPVVAATPVVLAEVAEVAPEVEAADVAAAEVAAEVEDVAAEVAAVDVAAAEVEDVTGAEEEDVVVTATEVGTPARIRVRQKRCLLQQKEKKDENTYGKFLLTNCQTPNYKLFKDNSVW